MDIDIFNDIKIRKMIKRQGGKAVTIYALLLCNIYKNGYYLEWDKELPFICSELTGFDEAYVSEVIKSCLTLGLFSKELYEAHQVLTSKGIQTRYERICLQGRRACRIVEYSLITPGETTKKKSRKASPIQPPSKPAPKPAKQTPAAPPNGYNLTLDQEIEQLRSEDGWLDQLQVLHHADKETLRSRLPDFRAQCLADGKERHQSLADAKQHFNAWLRIALSPKRRTNEEDKPRGRNQRRGHILAADEPKAYGDAF